MLLLLLLSIRVTPLIFSIGTTGDRGGTPAVTFRAPIMPVHTVLDQLRTPPLLVQVYLNVSCVTTAQTSSELELLTIVSVDTVH